MLIQLQGASTVMLRIGRAGLVLSMLAILVCPAAWSVTPCLVTASATQPSAGPGILGRSGGPMDFNHALERSAPLIAYLRQHRTEEKWLLATGNVTEAAPLIVATGEPVMAIGGWQGSDPTISETALEQKIRNHELRFVLLSSLGRSPVEDARLRHIRDNATPVARRRWQAQTRGENPGPGFPGAGRTGLYDCAQL